MKRIILAIVLTTAILSPALMAAILPNGPPPTAGDGWTKDKRVVERWFDNNHKTAVEMLNQCLTNAQIAWGESVMFYYVADCDKLAQLRNSRDALRMCGYADTHPVLIDIIDEIAIIEAEMPPEPE